MLRKSSMAIRAQLYSVNFGITEQQQQQQQQQQFLQVEQMQHLPQRNQNLLIDNAFAYEIEKERLEVDQFLILQNERLRLALQEQTKQQLSCFLKKYELKLQFLLQQKDEQIAKALHRIMEFENQVKRMEIENQTWRRVAAENEAMVISLKNTIENLRENRTLSTNNMVEDAESCCGQKEENGEERVKNIFCRSCNCSKSGVVILPCRHLCLCQDCDDFIKFCPVCRTTKKASIQVLFS